MSGAAVRPQFQEIPIGLIDEPTLAARSSMDDQALEELASDIRRKGLLQPIIVARLGERFEVIAGHRRRIASERAGLVAVPCLVWGDKDAAHEGLKYSENRFREELSPTDEAILFSELLERDCGGDVDKLCHQLGEGRAYVENRLNLFAGDVEVFNALAARKITIGVAHQLNRCTDELIRRSYLRSAVQGGATVAIVSGWINEWRAIADASTPTLAAPPPDDAPSPIPVSDPFTCAVCGKNHHVHLLKHVPVHDYCKLAILDPLLETYRGSDDPTPVANDPRRI